HTVSREHALIAHTRNNAYLFFRENDLGSMQSGRFADLAVIDKDYLTVPADQIKDIKSVLTMVGGRVVYDAANEPSTSTKQGGGRENALDVAGPDPGAGGVTGLRTGSASGAAIVRNASRLERRLGDGRRNCLRPRHTDGRGWRGDQGSAIAPAVQRRVGGNLQVASRG